LADNQANTCKEKENVRIGKQRKQMRRMRKERMRIEMQHQENKSE
jgi:hypothetical protein